MKLTWLAAVYMIYLMGTTSVLPWRIMVMSVYDVILIFFIVYQFTIVPFFEDNQIKEEDQPSMANYLLFLGFLPVGICGCAMMRQLYLMKFPPSPTYQAAANLTWEVVRNVDDQELLTASMKTYNDYDLLTIKRGMQLLIATGCVNVDMSMHVKTLSLRVEANTPATPTA